MLSPKILFLLKHDKQRNSTEFEGKSESSFGNFDPEFVNIIVYRQHWKLSLGIWFVDLKP